jgi:hypothetical protein
MRMDYERWQGELTTLITAALDEFRIGTEDDLERFVVDCHPWNGTIALAFLTRSESEDNQFLRETSEMAAWRYYDFGAALRSWRSAPGVASAMRVVYEGGRREPASRIPAVLPGVCDGPGIGTSSTGTFSIPAGQRFRHCDYVS